MVAQPVTHAGLTIIRHHAWLPAELEQRIATWQPKSGLGWLVRRAIIDYRLPAEAAAELLDAITRCVVIESALWLVKFDGLTGQRTDYGLVSQKKLTTVGVGYIVDAFQNSVEMENMKYHGLGTGAVAESNADTALGTELTTEYVGNTRATGTTTEGASANIYRTVGAVVLDSGTPAVTEHGVFSAASAGVLLDRSVFTAINLVGASGDGITATYELTCSAEA